MRLLFMIFLIVIGFDLQGQNPDKVLNAGDIAFDQEEYVDAEENYQKAAELGAVDIANYNLGNTLAAQGRYEEAAAAYEGAVHSTQNKQLKADAYYNQGNSYANSQKYKEAVDSYKNALAAAPEDKAIKQNLSYVLKQIKEQQKQQEQQQQNKDNQSKDKENNPPKDQKHQQSNSQPNQGNNNAQERDQKPLDQQQVDSILEMMQHREEQVQANMRRKNNKMSKSDKDW